MLAALTRGGRGGGGRGWEMPSAALGPSQVLGEALRGLSQALFFQPLPQAQPGVFRIEPLTLGTRQE